MSRRKLDIPETNDWTIEDWRFLHESIEEIKTIITLRHRSGPPLPSGPTPGPWRIGNLPSFDAYTGKPFRNVWAPGGTDDEIGVVIARAIDNGDVGANARLIAAAPDLLAACEAVLRRCEIPAGILDGGALVKWLHDKVRAAVARAKGGDVAS